MISTQKMKEKGNCIRQSEIRELKSSAVLIVVVNRLSTRITACITISIKGTMCLAQLHPFLIGREGRIMTGKCWLFVSW